LLWFSCLLLLRHLLRTDVIASTIVTTNIIITATIIIVPHNRDAERHGRDRMVSPFGVSAPSPDGGCKIFPPEAVRAGNMALARIGREGENPAGIPWTARD
jgi:hypothetical protein